MLKTSKMHGFTLIELMVTLAVLAIIIAIAVPNMSSFSKKQSVRSTADELRLSMTYARSEALKHNKDIYVLPIVDHAATGWNSGWCVVETASNCAQTSALLRTFSPSGKNVEINNNKGYRSSNNRLTFDKKGMLKNGGSETIFTVKDSSLPDTDRRCVELKKTGRASVVACQ